MLNQQTPYFSECESEKLHQIGSIQSHGCLLAGDMDNDKITYASENVQDFFYDLDSNSLLGQDLNHLFPDLSQKLDSIKGSRRLVFGGLNTKAGITDVIYSHNESCWLLEFFPGGTNFNDQDANRHIASFFSYQAKLLELSLHFANINRLNETLLSAAYDILQYEHIMIYRFSRDESGEVIAEINHGELDNYLGLRFPASDIPQSARRLYQLNSYRAIPDINSPVVKVISQVPGSVLDLTLSDLRASSPVHLQYLENMGVKASLSFPIIVSGNLWGIMACHSSSPLDINLNRKETFSSLVNTYAMGITHFQVQQELSVYSDVENLTPTLFKLLLPTLQKDFINDDSAKKLMAIFNATGFIYVDQDKTYFAGDIAENAFVSELTDWLFDQAFETVFHTDKLATFFLPASSEHTKASGLLAIKLSNTEDLTKGIIFLRPEIPVIINWAGNPDKTFELEDKGDTISISPRNSFKLWQVEMQGQSEEWSDKDIMIAKNLQKIALQLLSSIDY